MKQLVYRVGVMSLLVVSQLMAADKLEGFFEEANSYLITVIGPAIVLIGIAVAGLYMALGRPEGVKRGIWAITGGVVLSLSTWLYNLAITWAA